MHLRNKPLSINHQLLSLIQQSRNPRQIINHRRTMPHKQQFFRIRRQSKVRRWLSLRKLVDPFHKVTDTSFTRQDKRIVLLLHARDDVVVFFEGGWREEVVHEAFELLEIALVVDFAAVGFGYERADHIPGEFLGRDIGAALGDGFDPVVDDECGAFVLLRS